MLWSLCFRVIQEQKPVPTSCHHALGRWRLAPNPGPSIERAGNAGVAESVDATDLSQSLSARGEIRDAELLKFGETFQLAIPSQALR